MISAKIIADSKNEFGQRLTTFVLTFPRIVLAEFNTHRMISKNSASSRAIPFKKMVKMVQENPFIPIRWMKDHSGMQGNEYFENTFDLHRLEKAWLKARDYAVQQASFLNEAGQCTDEGLTKQMCNRLLEPFLWHTVIATGTEWENFFALRANEQAEIHIQDLAYKMLEVYNASEPKRLKDGEWHIPFGDKIDWVHIQEALPHIDQEDRDITAVKIATARCARVSYLNFEGKDDYEADIKLYDRLAASGHYSPFEHCAKAMSEEEYKASMNANPIQNTMPYMYDESTKGWCGNFRGFIQLRKTMQGENKTDDRVLIR